MLWYKIWLLTIFLALRGLSEDARSLTMSSVFLEASLNPSFKHTRYFSTCMPNRSRCFLESEGRLSFSCRYKQCYHQLPATWLISEKKAAWALFAFLGSHSEMRERWWRSLKHSPLKKRLCCRRHSFKCQWFQVSLCSEHTPCCLFGRKPFQIFLVLQDGALTPAAWMSTSAEFNNCGLLQNIILGSNSAHTWGVDSSYLPWRYTEELSAFDQMSHTLGAGWDSGNSKWSVAVMKLSYGDPTSEFH